MTGTGSLPLARPAPPADLLIRSRVLLRVARRPIGVAAVAAGASAFLAGGGRLAPAVFAILLGGVGGLLSLVLALAAVETRWALRWPRLHLRGWQPRLHVVAGRSRLPAALPEALYGAAEGALSRSRAARSLLGVRVARFGSEVLRLVRKGEAAFERAAMARAFLEAARPLPPPSGEGREGARSDAATDALARVVLESARARCEREVQVEAGLQRAEAELVGVTRVLRDLALRLSGLEAELSAAEAERRQLLPCLEQLHEQMRALEQASADPLVADPERVAPQAREALS